MDVVLPEASAASSQGAACSQLQHLLAWPADARLADMVCRLQLYRGTQGNFHQLHAIGTTVAELMRCMRAHRRPTRPMATKRPSEICGAPYQQLLLPASAPPVTRHWKRRAHRVETSRRIVSCSVMSVRPTSSSSFRSPAAPQRRCSSGAPQAKALRLGPDKHHLCAD